MKALIVTGGSIDVPFTRRFLENKSYDKIIAADSGLAHCEALGIAPTDILGDFDSLENMELLDKYKQQGIEIKVFPARKDFTDTHLAFQYAIDIECQTVTVLGATGTRYDHTLANISLLGQMADHGIRCEIVDKHNTIEMLSGKTKRVYQKKEARTYFSILAFSNEVTGLSLTGFSYPLEHAKLSAINSLGVSNEITAEEATLSMETGYLLVIQSND